MIEAQLTSAVLSLLGWFHAHQPPPPPRPESDSLEIPSSENECNGIHESVADKIGEKLPAAKYSNAQLTERLARVHNIEELTKLLRSMDISFQTTANARLIWRHVLSDSWPENDVLQLLYDPAFSPRRFVKWREIFKYLRKNDVGDRYRLYLKAILHAVERGIVSPPEFASILRWLYAVKVGGSRLGETPDFYHWTSRFAQAVQACPILSFADLRTRDRKYLVFQLLEAPRKYLNRALIESICESIPSWNLFVAVREYFQRRRKTERLSSLKTPFARTLKLFTFLNNGSVLRAIIDQTIWIYSGIPNMQEAPLQLDKWKGHIRQMLIKDNDLAEEQNWSDTFGLQCGLFEVSQMQSILLRLWVVHILSDRNPIALRAASKSLYSILELGLFQDSIPLAKVLENLLSLSLPTGDAYPVFSLLHESVREPIDRVVTGSKELARRCDSNRFMSLIDPVGFYKSTVTHLISQKPISSFADIEAWYFLQENVPLLLRLMSESVNDRYGRFLDLALRMIYEDENASITILRMIKYNVHFKIALSMSRRYIHGPTYDSESISEEALFASLTKTMPQQNLAGSGDSSSHNLLHSPSLIRKEILASSLNPLTVLLALEAMVAAFAMTPKLSHRQAFQRIQQCINILQYYSAPVRPSLTRWLWFISLERFGEHGFSVRQLAWITAKIREIEGTERARKFLTKLYQKAPWIVERVDRFGEFDPEPKYQEDIDKRWLAGDHFVVDSLVKGVEDKTEVDFQSDGVIVDRTPQSMANGLEGRTQLSQMKETWRDTSKEDLIRSKVLLGGVIDEKPVQEEVVNDSIARAVHAKVLEETGQTENSYHDALVDKRNRDGSPLNTRTSIESISEVSDRPATKSTASSKKPFKNNRSTSSKTSGSKLTEQQIALSIDDAVAMEALRKVAPRVQQKHDTGPAHKDYLKGGLIKDSTLESSPQSMTSPLGCQHNQRLRGGLIDDSTFGSNP